MTDQKKIEDKFIPHSKPTLGAAESRAVSEIVASGHIAEGEVAKAFEKNFARYLGVDHAVSTNSGTSALHLTLLALDVGPGDEVIIPSYVCSALLNAVKYTGARPVLADIDPITYHLDAADVQRRLTVCTKAIILPHLFGAAANMEPFLKLDVPIVEDCAQSIGATFNRQPVGTFGQAAIFSFYATKVITTGEGGMVATRSGSIAERIRDLKKYDKRKNYKVRFNYKMADIQAALGIEQLNRLDTFIRRRRAIAEDYSHAFGDFELQLPPVDDPGHIYFRYTIGVNREPKSWIEALNRLGIGCERPIHLPLHRNLGLDDFPATDEVWNRTISIPIYPSLSDDETIKIITALIDCQKKMPPSD